MKGMDTQRSVKSNEHIRQRHPREGPQANMQNDVLSTTAKLVSDESYHTWVNEYLLCPYRQRERMQIHSMTQGAMLAMLVPTIRFHATAAAATGALLASNLGTATTAACRPLLPNIRHVFT